MDPFDHTYNPAKQVLSREKLEEQYFSAMRETLDGIIHEQEIWLEPPLIDEDTCDGLPLVAASSKKAERNKRRRIKIQKFKQEAST
jgi:hypothetical protein